MKRNPIKRRLIKEHKELINAVSNSDFVSIVKKEGNPPYIYYLEVKGLKTCVENSESGKIITGGKINIEISIFLTPEYPIQPPVIQILKSNKIIANPNVSKETGLICYTTQRSYSAKKTSLAFIVHQLIEILRFKTINIEQNALNPRTAQWARAHMQEFPTDNKTFLNGNSINTETSSEEEIDIEIIY